MKHNLKTVCGEMPDHLEECIDCLYVRMEMDKLIEELKQLKQKAKDAMEADDIEAFSKLEETISYYRGQICIPIDEILGEKKEGESQP